MTFLHELGHYIHLCILCIIFQIPLQKPKFIIHKIKKGLFIFYKGKTINSTYNFLVENKKYFSIKTQSIFGSLFTIIFFIFTEIFILKHSQTLKLFFTVPFFSILLEISNFLWSSDFKYFRHPELFEYHPELH